MTVLGTTAPSSGAPSVPTAHASSDSTLHVVRPSPQVDLAAAETAAADFLAALGLDLDAESTRETPRRMAAAYAEMFSPRPFDLTTFPNDQGYDELVLARSIPVQSVCEHHLLPFIGVAHVGYLPGDRIVGLSKLARVVEMFARRPQVQERLTQQVADWLQAELAPRGVGVVIEAEHLCMSVRGVRAAGASTVTSALHGLLRDRPETRAEFLALATTGQRPETQGRSATTSTRPRE
ncbi:MAG TPA: GTP cyclohydrolase I FolE [Actinomycetales bacterium]|nr:GTP cyclohydrolase I FolE [Actinomycetales bacterium]